MAKGKLPIDITVRRLSEVTGFLPSVIIKEARRYGVDINTRDSRIESICAATLVGRMIINGTPTRGGQPLRLITKD